MVNKCYLVPTTLPSDCEYDITPELFDLLPKTYGDDTVVELTPDGGIKFTFPEPRDVTEIILQSPDGAPALEAVPETEESAPAEESPLDADTETPFSNPINEQDVTSITIRRTDSEPIEPEDVTILTVVACEEGKVLRNAKICSVSFYPTVWK